MLAALLSGVTLALAFEPYRLWFFVPFSIAIFIVCMRGLRLFQALVAGFFFGAGFMLVLIYWLRVVGYDAWIGLALLEAVFYSGLGAVTAVVTRLPGWPIWTATAWLGCEVLSSSGVTGWLPWGRVSYAMVDTPLAGAFTWVGGNGTTFLLALLGSMLVWVASEGSSRPVGAVSALIAVIGAALIPGLVPAQLQQEGEVTVAAIQGNVPGDGTDILLDHRQVTRNHVEATMHLADEVKAGHSPEPDFVIWPENTTAVDPFEDSTINAEIRRASGAIGVPLLVGVIVDAPQNTQVLNQGIVWDPITGAGDRYTKQHPVAMGEYIPYRSGLLTKFVSRLALVSRDMIAGTRDQPLLLGNTLVADAICFDVAYDDAIGQQIKNGAQMIVVQTSNALFIETSEIEQQFAISRLRAVETGRFVVVAATNGISGIIAPDGSVVTRAKPRTQTSLVETIDLYRGTTIGVWLGPWLGRAAMVVTLVAVGSSIAYRRRVNRIPPASKREVLV
jgi:apolipoprotein N-acyltransferase